jgi:lipopolysaccharide export system permease protein
MKFSSTLNRYLGRAYAVNLLFMVGILWGVIYLFDTVELLRRASKRSDVPLSTVMKMGLLKLPDMGLTIFSFAILFSAIYTFWRLNRRNELVVVRAAGFSVHQFLSPIIGVAVLTGFLLIAIVNPFSAVLLGRYKAMESKYLTHNRNQIALFDQGLWLRQEKDDGNYIILHAANIKMPGWNLGNATAWYFGPNDSFRKRIDAKSATLSDRAWLFQDVTVNEPDSKMKSLPLIKLPTDLTPQDIEESFASPETMSVWRLPAFIRTVESTGFDTARLKIHFQSLLAQPFLFAAMIFLAAAVSLHPPRFRSTLTMLVMGIGAGFAVFFTSSFLSALGASHQIPVFLAAWSPAFVMSLLGIAALLTLEDG